MFLAAARTTKASASVTASYCMPPGFYHPARVAERIATLDLVSDGRVEFGTGEIPSRMELEASRRRRHQTSAYLEAVEQCAT